LLDIANNKEIPDDVIEMLGRVSITMSDSNMGGLFVICDDINSMDQKYYNSLEQISLKLESESIREYDDEQMINLAKEDGAVLLDKDGNVHSFMALLSTQKQKNINSGIGKGARHFYAQSISHEISCLCITISEDGRITLYNDGNLLYEL